MALKYTLVDVVPKSDSGESVQNSEPSITVDPLDPNQLIVGAFGASGSSYFKSTNGGITWSDYGSLVSNDKSLAWKTDGSAALTVSMDENASPNTFSTYSGTTAASNFGAPINVFSGDDLDQPWIRTGPSNHVYVAYNDLDKAGPSDGGTGNGGTASVLISNDGGNTYRSVTLDRVGDPFQDDPSVRLAVNGNTVYGVFVRWNTEVESDATGARFGSQVVVVRSDNGGADNFAALGSGGNGVQVATTTDVFTDTGGTTLSIGKERIAAEAAIAVDPNNANHVLVAYQNAPGANGVGQVQLVVAESNDGGATWSTKFTTSSAVRSSQEAISILDDGAIGFLYDSFDPATQQLSQHFLTTTDDFATTNDTTLATESNAGPSVQFQPYLGDFFDLTSIGNTFYGTFCASNADNGTGAQFANLNLQRDFTGTLGTGSFQLTDSFGNAVAASIDPYFFSCTLQPPTVAGLSDASYAAFGSPVTLSAGLSLADVSSTTLNSATVQITGGTFAGDGDVLAANTTGTAISASYNAANEMLTLTGLDTLADYQTVLDSVTFSSNSADPTDSGNDNSRTVTWDVNDGSFSSTPQNTTITVSPATTPPNPSPPAGTTADLIMERPSSGDYEIYDFGHNAALANHLLTNIASPWQTVGLGNFSGSGTSDMLLRNMTTGVFAIVDVTNNNASAPIPLGAVGLEWQVAGFGDFSGHPGETDMLMRDASNGAFELYDFSNNSVPFAGPLSGINPNATVLGFGDFSGKPNETDMLTRDSTQSVVLYDINNNAVTSSTTLGNLGLEWQFAAVGDFSSRAGETDLLMRDVNNGNFELYDFQNGMVTAAIALGNVGLEWQVAGTADFSGNPNETDLLMRDVNNGNFELYDFSNNAVPLAIALGNVGLDWQVVGAAPYQASAAATAPLDLTQSQSATSAASDPAPVDGWLTEAMQPSGAANQAAFGGTGLGSASVSMAGTPPAADFGTGSDVMADAAAGAPSPLVTQNALQQLHAG